MCTRQKKEAVSFYPFSPSLHLIEWVVWNGARHCGHGTAVQRKTFRGEEGAVTFSWYELVIPYFFYVTPLPLTRAYCLRSGAP